jgi:hypothetical protein
MVIDAADEVEEMDGWEEDDFGVVAKVGEAGAEVGETANPFLLQAHQETTGGAEDAGVEIQVFRGADHVFWPISQFTYM